MLDKIYEKFTLAPVLTNIQKRMSATQWFGENNLAYYRKVGMKGHNAIDMVAEIGTPTFAAFDGVVTSVFSDPDKDTKKGEYVRYISEEIDLDGLTIRLRATHYHLHKANVEKDAKIKAGQQIGETGNTGEITTGPHLHFSIKPEKKVDGYWTQMFPNNGYFGAIDPYPFFLAKDFFGAPDDAKLIRNSLVKSVFSSKVYWVDAWRKLAWIENEQTFNAGGELHISDLESLWGGWGDIKEITAKLEEDYIINIRNV